MKVVAFAALAALAVAAPADAQWAFQGHVKYQFSLQHFRPGDLEAALVAPDVREHTMDLRLNARYRRRRLDVTTATEITVLGGNGVAAERTLPASLGQYLPALSTRRDPHQWLDLDRTLTTFDRATLVGRLDRLSVGYTGDHFVARLGRQALSWGNGLVFQTLDLVNPFPPDVLDTDYKPGRDMLTTQWLFANGDDVQVIAVPGREGSGRPLTAGESSLAGKWHHFAGGMEVDVLAARHHGSTVVGGGASHSLAGGVWRVDVSDTSLPTGQVGSLLANFDHGWAPGGRSLYAFGEYFYSGFGVDRIGPRPHPDRIPRCSTGWRVANCSTSGGTSWRRGCDTSGRRWSLLSPTAIVNLTDGSTFALVQVEYDWRQNLVLYAGVQAGLGARGSEYGGVASSATGGSYLAPGTRVWARLARYL